MQGLPCLAVHPPLPPIARFTLCEPLSSPPAATGTGKKGRAAAGLLLTAMDLAVL